MSQPRLNRIFGLQLLTLALLLAVPIWLWLYALDKHALAQQRIEQAEPRYARLQGLISRHEDISQYTLETQKIMESLAFPATQDAAQTGSEAQQRIRSIFAESDLDIGSIQILPLEEGLHYDRIPIRLRVEGDITGVHKALSLLATQTPAIGLDNWSLQTIGQVNSTSKQRLGAQFNFFVVRARS